MLSRLFPRTDDSPLWVRVALVATVGALCFVWGAPTAGAQDPTTTTEATTTTTESTTTTEAPATTTTSTTTTTTEAPPPASPPAAPTVDESSPVGSREALQWLAFLASFYIGHGLTR